MNLLAFVLVLAAAIIGVIVAGMAWQPKAWPTFLLGLGLALCSVGVIVQDIFIHWSRTVHSG